MFKIIEKGKIKKFVSPEYNYAFNKETGFFVRFGKTINEDPPFSKYGPEIADVEISTICKKGCNYCFIPGTLIETNNGKVKIENLKKDDIVKSFSIEENKIVDNKILETYENYYDGVIIEIELEDGSIVKTTPEHPFYVKGIGFVEAKNITEDMDIQTYWVGSCTSY